MAKTFNITGPCNADKHYTADVSKKLAEIESMIAAGDYFTINKPRQYGKTTIIHLIEQRLSKKKEYLVLGISFEEIDAVTYQKQESFIATFIDIIKEQLEFLNEKELLSFTGQYKSITNFKQLDLYLSQLISKSGRKTVILIDEVDKACNNQLFLDFLGMLRSKYLKQNQGKGHTFHSVILAGVHDVKTLKTKIRPNDEQKFNSPWNIAVDLKTKLSFTVEEIESLLNSFLKENPGTVDSHEFAAKLHYLTSGHPFLVSRLCKIFHEDIKHENNWQIAFFDEAVKQLLDENNTNFKSVIKNLENNSQLYDLTYRVVIEGDEFNFNRHNPIIEMGSIHGIFSEKNGRLKIHNRIYEQLIYNYMASKLETSVSMGNYNFMTHFLLPGDRLDFKNILLRFQAFLKEQYSAKDLEFLERNGRLLFLSFLKPIINGKGYDFKEVEISEEKRLDIVVTFLTQKYIVELKKWYGETAHQKGVTQLADYLTRQSLDTGYLIIYDLRKKSGKAGKNETIIHEDKTIFAVWV
ncbi:MAG: AAA family ATPase [bacterium]|nr:AAA family ATPase [bacterium]